jgi:hypothetical protein
MQYRSNHSHVVSHGVPTSYTVSYVRVIQSAVAMQPNLSSEYWTQIFGYTHCCTISPTLRQEKQRLKWPNGFIYPCLFASKMFSATDLFCGKDNQRKETLRGSFETFGFQRSRFSLLWSHTPPIVHTGIAVINLLLSSLSWEGPEPHMVHQKIYFKKYTSNKSI